MTYGLLKFTNSYVRRSDVILYMVLRICKVHTFFNEHNLHVLPRIFNSFFILVISHNYNRDIVFWSSILMVINIHTSWNLRFVQRFNNFAKYLFRRHWSGAATAKATMHVGLIWIDSRSG